MQFPSIRLFLAVACILISGVIMAQEKSAREIEIHKNVKLIELPPMPNTPDEMIQQYQAFRPLLVEILKENTTAETDECTLTMRVTPGFKAIGSAKTQRPTASISAFRKNAKQEYQGVFILYSYINAGPVSKEETLQFLKKQILEPAACHKD